ncbi:hypothetical protein [Rhodovulum sp. YEN HP10]|uniref:hypothetical protein n=1 Tax=Rhodovulum sp. HP10 TaxID=3387397 RepID=UPI0039E016BB
MKDGPDISRSTALTATPMRASIPMACLGEPTFGPGISAAPRQPTEAAPIRVRKQGRHRHFALAGSMVAGGVRVGLARARGHLRSRTGPRNATPRRIRVWHDLGTGPRAVALLKSLAARGGLTAPQQDAAPTGRKPAFFARPGLALPRTGRGRRPICRACPGPRAQCAGGLCRPERACHLPLTPVGAHALAEAFPT